MHKLGVVLLLSIVVSACEGIKPEAPSEGSWRGELAVMDGQVLPFNFRLVQSGPKNYAVEITNAEELISVDEVTIKGDSIIIKTPVFEGYIAGTYTKDQIKGKFIKESLERVVPFKAIYGPTERFDAKNEPTANVSGIWETVFESGTDDAYLGKGVFSQNGKKVSGTFQTTTGDYRYLDGIVDGDSLKLSTFDGAHAFLFTAKIEVGAMKGIFYSGNHSKETFVGKRNMDYELPSPDSLTYLKEGFDSFSFRFPNADGNLVSLDDPRFKGKVVVVQLMGTWCPNCLDETKFLVDYMKRNANEELAIVALAFEYAKTEAGAFKSIARLADRIGVNYPILLAQYGSSDKEEAQQKLPMLNHVLSYPTTIFLDKQGQVRKIHTGFNGPATGEKYELFKQEFDVEVKRLLSE
jgi:thiol-disulfide isomerase/thioredoxin